MCEFSNLKYFLNERLLKRPLSKVETRLESFSEASFTIIYCVLYIRVIFYLRFYNEQYIVYNMRRT